MQRHLKGIRKILGESLETPNIEEVKSKLRACLPKSYGLASGRVCNDLAHSKAVQLPLYDLVWICTRFSLSLGSKTE